MLSDNNPNGMQIMEVMSNFAFGTSGFSTGNGRSFICYGMQDRHEIMNQKLIMYPWFGVLSKQVSSVN